MTYTIPTTSSYQSFFSDVNDLVGSNIAVIGTLVMIFFISLFAASGAGKRFEISLAFASWMTAISSYFIVIMFHVTAYLSVIPTLMAVVSLFLMEVTRP